MPFFTRLAAVALAVCATSAFAAPKPAPLASSVTFDFSHLKTPGGGAGDLLPSEVLNSGYWKCTGGDLCSSDINNKVFGGDLKYTIGGLTATVTGYYNGKQVTAMQDHDGGYNPAKFIGAGLGVYHKLDNGDDNVTKGEFLKLTFSQAVTLTGVSLRADGHTGKFDEDSTFLLDGHGLKLAHDLNNLSITRKEFTFGYGGHEAEQFYLGGVTVSPVPEPETYALLLAGLGLLGVAARRRKYSN